MNVLLWGATLYCTAAHGWVPPEPLPVTRQMCQIKATLLLVLASAESQTHAGVIPIDASHPPTPHLSWITCVHARVYFVSPPRLHHITHTHMYPCIALPLHSFRLYPLLLGIDKVDLLLHIHHTPSPPPSLPRSAVSFSREGSRRAAAVRAHPPVLL